jgi:mannose-6-phosphate isomerase-like protein (cupin superfamily)
MIIRRSEARQTSTENCHGGTGLLKTTEMLGDYGKKDAGFTYIHDNMLEPGASIGVHTHEGDEEVYFILEGYGTMEVDGEETKVGPGDICLTRDGHSHSLKNSDDGPMRMLVFCANL